MRPRGSEDTTNAQIPDWLDGVGPGWHDILMRAHAELVAALPGYKVAQVKEKYGGLRIHLLPFFDEETGELGIPRELGNRISAIIRAAEDESLRTCERCGRPGELTGKPWYKTLCPDHAPPTSR